MGEAAEGTWRETSFVSPGLVLIRALLQPRFPFIFSSSPQVPSTPSSPFFEPLLAIDLQRSAKTSWHRKRAQMPPRCAELGGSWLPALGNPGAVIEMPVIWVNCVLWTPAQRHSSLMAPPINNLYVYIAKPGRFISVLCLCLFVCLSSGSRLPAAKPRHFLHAR